MSVSINIYRLFVFMCKRMQMYFEDFTLQIVCGKCIIMLEMCKSESNKSTKTV